jgi:C4-dicarboxylate-specific signal transduction histidine kinase
MLRRRLILPAAAIALALSLVLSGVGFWVGGRIVSVVADQMVLSLVDDIHRDIGVWVGRSNRVLSRVAADIARQAIPLDDPHAVLRELYGVLDDEPQVDWLYFANEAGGNVSVGRLEDTKVFLMTDGFRAGVMRQYDASPDGQPGHLRKSSAEFDPRQKSWYKQARDTHTRYWTDPYLGASEAVLGMSLSAPVLNKDGRFMGVIGTDVILTQLAREMRLLILGDKGRVFIIDTNGQLIASSGGVTPVATSADGSESRVLASDANDAVVRGTARHLRTQPDILGQLPGTGLQSFSFDDPVLGKSYAAIKSFQAPGGISWTVVAAVPASDFLGPARSAVLFSVAVSVFVLALALVLGTWMVGLALRPLTALTEAARSIGRGEWPEVPEVQRNDEIGLLARAFKFMIASLKDTQDGLRRSEASLTEAQQIGHTGSWRWKVGTGEVSWSAECFRIFAADPATAQPSYETFLERVHPEDRPLAKQVLEQAVRERSRYQHEYRITLPDGSVKHVQAVGQPDITGSGDLEFVGTVMDITELRRAEEALRSAQAELLRVTQLTTTGELLASIAHEIHQPLAAIATSGSAGLRWLDRDQPDLDAARDALSRIVRDAHRAGNVIHGLRALAQKSGPQRTELDINDAIQEVLALSRSYLQQHGVVLHTDLSGEVRPVCGDRVQLQQVLLNLITNAFEAMSAVTDRPKVLTITSEPVEPYGMLVAVKDTGPGLDPAMADRIFTPFATTKPNGMGMGLSICRSIIDAHGGRIWVSPRVPYGTVFRFTVPGIPPD